MCIISQLWAKLTNSELRITGAERDTQRTTPTCGSTRTCPVRACGTDMAPYPSLRVCSCFVEKC